MVLHKRDYRRAPHFLTASRSRVRSRSQLPVSACGSYLPGQKVTPIRPCPDADVTAAMWSGCVTDVRAIARTPSSVQRISDRLDHAIPGLVARAIGIFLRSDPAGSRTWRNDRCHSAGGRGIRPASPARYARIRSEI